jgi:hypothetical protein
MASDKDIAKYAASGKSAAFSHAQQNGDLSTSKKVRVRFLGTPFKEIHSQ